MSRFEYLEQALVDAAARFKLKQLETPRFDAEVLLAKVLGCSRVELYAHGKEAISALHTQIFEDLVARRMAGEPMAYLLGHCEFFGLQFQVSKDVLIPRSDTERLVEITLKNVEKLKCSGGKLPTILDIGTGSGCIAITLALLTQATVEAWDISSDALKMATANAERLAAKVKFCCRDMLDGDSYKSGDKYDFIVANPPYIALNDKQVSASVVEYEPAIALFGGDDGLQFYRQVAVHAHNILSESGMLLLEIGYNQAQDITKILTDHGFSDVEIFQDLGGQNRVVATSLTSNP